MSGFPASPDIRRRRSFLRRCPALADGDRFWGQVGAFPGSFLELRARGDDGRQSGVDAGKTSGEPIFCDAQAPPETSMVRRGSTVRVRQRASVFCPAQPSFPLSALTSLTSSSVHRSGTRAPPQCVSSFSPRTPLVRSPLLELHQQLLIQRRRDRRRRICAVLPP